MATRRKHKNMSDQALKLVAERFKVLSEPTRLKLLMALETGEKTVSELVAVAQTGQANVSRQLQQMADAGVLGRRREGLHVYYRIIDTGVFELCDVVCGSLQNHFEEQVKALA